MLSCTLRSVPKKFVSCYNIRANVRTASWPLGFHANPKLITNQHTANVTNVSGVVSNYKCIQSRRFSSNATDAVSQAPELKSKYDAIIIGAGHNGLVAAAYLQKQGLNVCVVERRHVIGGAAVTEEIVPGFKFSRASYVLSLLRPQIIEELELKKHGLKVYLRNPNSYTPMLEPPGKSGRPRSLLLSADKSETARQIAQFSEKDAQRYAEYEEWLDRLVAGIEPLLDSPPVSLQTWTSGSLTEKWKDRGPFKTLIQTGKTLGDDLASFYEMLTAPATKILDKWFESEPLKATLATDAVIGAMQSPYSPGSGYVLIHHVMGELEGVKGAWGYVEGGMGAVSQAIANSARSHGTTVVTDKPVSQIKTDGSSNVTGIVLEDGTEIDSNLVLSNATPKVTYLDLVEKGVLPEDFVKAVEGIDYTSPVTKINIAVNALPNFLANPNTPDGKAQGHHMSGTIHLNCENVDIVHEAYVDAMQGKPSNRAVIEMTIPSSLDPTLAPPGCHVVQLFTQYTPYTLAGGKEWDDDARNAYADKVIDDIEQYAPGFRASIVGRDILTPPDLERIFNLTGGNIFHGSMNMDQLYFSRPVPAYSDYRSPVRGLYLCGSGAHPGGGVMGSPGRLAAMTALSDIKTKTVQV